MIMIMIIAFAIIVKDMEIREKEFMESLSFLICKMKVIVEPSFRYRGVVRFQ